MSLAEAYYLGRAGLVDVVEVVALGRHPPLDPDALVLATLELAADAFLLGRGHPQHEVGVLPQFRPAGTHTFDEEQFHAGTAQPVPHAGVAPVISLILDRTALACRNEHLVAQPLPVEVLAVPVLGIEAGAVIVIEVGVEVVALDDRR